MSSIYTVDQILCVCSHSLRSHRYFEPYEHMKDEYCYRCPCKVFEYKQTEAIPKAPPNPPVIKTSRNRYDQELQYIIDNQYRYEPEKDTSFYYYICHIYFTFNYCEEHIMCN